MSTIPSAPEQSPLIMGILNVTPDSFSDGGLFAATSAAVRHAERMINEGADIIDIGGESTRPGAQAVSPEEQCRRVLPIIEALRERLPAKVALSIDTTSARVAKAVLATGPAWINDTSAGRDDPNMLALAAEHAVPIVLMHRQGLPASMQIDPRYEDVVAEVQDFLAERCEAALSCGVPPDRLLIDPGIGFGKTLEHNLALMAGLDRLGRMGYPILLGASRKRFLGTLCAQPNAAELMPATCATTALGVMAGVRVFRVHDVYGNRQAADVAWAVRRASHSPRGYSDASVPT